MVNPNLSALTNGQSFELGDPIRVFIDGFNQIGFFIAFQNQALYWGTTIDNQSRLVITPFQSIQSIVKL